MKLKSKEKEYSLRGETITVNQIPAIEGAKILSKAQNEEFLKDLEGQIPLYSEIALKYTSLGQDNTQEEIEQFLTFKELSDLATFALDVEEEVSEAKKNQK